MINTFNVLSEVLNEASKQFGGTWKVSQNKLDVLKQYCAAIDLLCEEVDASALETSVDDIKMTISIKVQCPEVVIKTKENLFYMLMSRTVRTDFSQIDGELLIDFVFPSIWEHI